MINALEVNTEALNSLEFLLVKDGKIIPVPANELKRFSQNNISVFCLKHGIYQLPTTELIEWLQKETHEQRKVENNVIEIGSGNGCIGRNIPVPMFDNHLQNTPEIKAIYEKFKQPTITYGKDVKNMTANEAIDKFLPHTVIGCWVTQYGAHHSVVDSNPFGVKELDFQGKIKRYIVVGNENVHSKKLILDKVPYTIFKPSWLVTRSMQPEANVIYDFDFSKT